MFKLTEPELREFDATNAITEARIEKSDDGFVLVINVNWRKGDLTVFSQRNRPRAWQSLDRLVRYLERVAPSIKVLEIHLTGG